MRDLAALKQRYEQDRVAVQIGGLASNLSRIAWCMRRSEASAGLAAMLRESKYFAEWAAARAPLETQEVLAEVQVELALWERKSAKGQFSPEDADMWVQRLLRVSGLMAE